jgi:predicted dehydrogenase
MKIGFIGGYGHHYLRPLLEGDVQSAAASDGYDADSARRFAAAQKIAKWYDDPLKLMDEFRPDVLSIGAVYAFNGVLAAEALKRDIPTVSDKPIAATWEQLAVLRRLTDEKPRILLTEFDFRSRAGFRSAQQCIASGTIGEVILVTAQKSYRWGTRPAWYAKRDWYGGTVLWIASHAIDAAQWVTGRRIARVSGHQGNLSHPDYGTLEDHLAVVMELDNGGTAVAHADFLRPAAAPTHGDDRIRIAGSKGVIEARDGHCKLITSENAETDITELATVLPVHEELMLGLHGKSKWFSTAISLSTAETLLYARDAVDGQKWVSL